MSSTSAKSTSNGGAGNLAQQLYQVWKALRDPSIPWAAKWLIPLAALAYWISPVDLMPFFPVDDIVVVLIAINLFLHMIARYQNQETGDASRQASHSSGNTHRAQDKTIETTWRVVED